jgi:hypothetical protein
MNSEFPYQLVTFLDEEPQLDEPVYYGENGWYAQLALKRRFAINDVDEDDFIALLRPFFADYYLLQIFTGDLVKPDRMPVQVIDILNQKDLKELHIELLKYLGEKIVSRYPDREGNNYYPHITAEYDNEFVIPIAAYKNKEFLVNNIWLLKDVDGENSQAYRKII